MTIFLALFYGVPFTYSMFTLVRFLYSSLAALSRPTPEQLLLNHAAVLTDPYTYIYAETIKEKFS